MLTRRSLIGGLAAFIAAPAVIRVAQLMPVKAFGPYPAAAMSQAEKIIRYANSGYFRFMPSEGEDWCKNLAKIAAETGWKLRIETCNEVVHGEAALDMLNIDRDWFRGIIAEKYPAMELRPT